MIGLTDDVPEHAAIAFATVRRPLVTCPGHRTGQRRTRRPSDASRPERGDPSYCVTRSPSSSGCPPLSRAGCALTGRRRPALRLTVVAAVVALLTIAAINTTTAPSTAFRTTPVDPHAAARMAATVEADHRLDEPVVIDFSAANGSGRGGSRDDDPAVGGRRGHLDERRTQPAHRTARRLGAGPVLHDHDRGYGHRTRRAPGSQRRSASSSSRASARPPD